MIVAVIGAGPSRMVPALQAQTAADLRRVAAVLTHDSLAPRAAPSGALERTARYVAGEFERLGLRPGIVEGGASSWIQRYPMPGRRRLEPAQSAVVVQATLTAQAKPILTEAGRTEQRTFRADFATTAYVAADTAPVPIVAADPTIRQSEEAL